MRLPSVLILAALALLHHESVDAFQPCYNTALTRSCRSSVKGSSRLVAQMSSFYDDVDDDDDDDVDIDVDSLGDWRAFRKNLASNEGGDGDESPSKTRKLKSVSKENEELLMKQNKKLGQEYRSGIWAHEVATAEVGGLVCRLPVEAELYRNYRHNIIGQLLRKRLDLKSGKSEKPKQSRPSSFFEDTDEDGGDFASLSPQTNDESKDVATATWYKAAQKVVLEQMQNIANMAADGAVDASKLGAESSEMLQLFLHNQETWQEVCLVLERDESVGTATTVVLNRPMARKLSDDIARLLLQGIYLGRKSHKDNVRAKTDLVKFMLAFRDDIAVYVGGPDGQDQPATLVHGIKELEGAVEISPGSNIYRGGLDAAIDGVLEGKYNPLDFRFFVGRHEYVESKLDLEVVLGKYQPVACARALSLKQCIALPKPLWHEVLELCGGELAEISQLEMLKRDDLKFQVVEDDFTIVDELDELSNLDEDDDEDFFI